MPAVRHNIVVEQGVDFKLTLTRYADAAMSQVVNLIGHRVSTQFRKSYDAADPVYADDSNALGSGIQIDGNAGTITWKIPHTISPPLPAPWEGVYDLIDQDANGTGEIVRLIEGTVKITPAVTH